MTTLAQEATAETYEDVKLLIYKIIHQFMDKHGTEYGDFDELLSRANYDFCMYVMTGYEPERGAFTTWCSWAIGKTMLNAQRETIDRNKRVSVVDNSELDVKTNAGRDFLMIDAIDGLSDDGRYIVEMVLNPSKVLLSALQTRHTSGAGIRQFLIGKGWENSRISEALDNIKSTLKDGEDI